MSSLSDRSTPPVGPVVGLAGQASSPAVPSAAEDLAALPVLPRCISRAELAAALALTREMFGVEPEVEAMTNPEDPEHEWVEVAVTDGGTTRQRLDREIEWGTRMRSAVPNHLGRFTLAIYPPDEAR